MPGQDDSTSATPAPEFPPPSPEAIKAIKERAEQLRGSRKNRDVEIADKTDSVEFSVNAKGDVTYKVKACDVDVDKAADRAAIALGKARDFAESFKKGAA